MDAPFQSYFKFIILAFKESHIIAVCSKKMTKNVKKLKNKNFSYSNSGVQRINNVFHIVVKVENVCVNQYILDLIDNVEYVVYALYSSIFVFFHPIADSS